MEAALDEIAAGPSFFSVCSGIEAASVALMIAWIGARIGSDLAFRFREAAE